MPPRVSVPQCLCWAQPSMFDSSATVFHKFIYGFGLYAFIGFSIALNVRCLIFVWTYYCKSGVRWRGGPHTWAVITGATDAVGAEYAKQLAEKGYNLLLIGTNYQKLVRLKYEIRDRLDRCKVKVSQRRLCLQVLQDNYLNYHAKFRDN